MTAAHPALVVLRGNSGAGKTTIALALQRALGPGAANVGQDHLRRVVLREHEMTGGTAPGLIEVVARHCLFQGHHTIVEGMLRAERYRPMVLRLLTDHPGPVLIVYLDVPLPITLERHETRALRAEVDPQRLREWYLEDDRLGVKGEFVIESGGLDVGEVVALILDRLGPIDPCESPDRQDRYF